MRILMRINLRYQLHFTFNEFVHAQFHVDPKNQYSIYDNILDTTVCLSNYLYCGPFSLVQRPYRVFTLMCPVFMHIICHNFFLYLLMDFQNSKSIFITEAITIILNQLWSHFYHLKNWHFKKMAWHCYNGYQL